jgi:hypothetical protein
MFLNSSQHRCLDTHVPPGAVFIRCSLIKDAERIRLSLLEKVEESYMPEIRIIGHSGEYMYYGAQVMADRETT